MKKIGSVLLIVILTVLPTINIVSAEALMLPYYFSFKFRAAFLCNPQKPTEYVVSVFAKNSGGISVTRFLKKSGKHIEFLVKRVNVQILYYYGEELRSNQVQPEKWNKEFQSFMGLDPRIIENPFWNDKCTIVYSTDTLPQVDTAEFLHKLMGPSSTPPPAPIIYP